MIVKIILDIRILKFHKKYPPLVGTYKKARLSEPNMFIKYLGLYTEFDYFSAMK